MARKRGWMFEWFNLVYIPISNLGVLTLSLCWNSNIATWCTLFVVGSLLRFISHIPYTYISIHTPVRHLHTTMWLSDTQSTCCPIPSDIRMQGDTPLIPQKSASRSSRSGSSSSFSVSHLRVHTTLPRVTLRGDMSFQTWV
jgi:hypothetical protein